MRSSHARQQETDVIYNRYPHAKIQEVADAMGVDERYVSFLTMKPDRYFYGACLTYVMENFAISALDEKQRGRIIKHIADRIYKGYADKFLEAYNSHSAKIDPTRQATFKKIDELILDMDRSCTTDGRHDEFDAKAFDLMWGPRGNSTDSWRSDAYEIYSQIRKNLTPEHDKKPKDIREITSFMTKSRWEFDVMHKAAVNLLATVATSHPSLKHPQFNYREVLQRQTNNYLIRLAEGKTEREEDRSAIKDLPVHAEKVTFLLGLKSNERTTQVFLGPMGGGKNTAMRISCKRHKQKGFMLLDPDYLKVALGKAAIDDGTVSRVNAYTTHYESSSIVLGLWKDLSQKAKTGQHVPNVITCTDQINMQRLEGMFAGGGKAEVHYLGASADVAKESCDIRGRKGGRTIKMDMVKDSVKKSARNLLDIAKFGGSDICVYLYDRDSAKGAPNFVGVMDMKTREVVINNPEAFLNIAARAKKAPKETKGVKAESPDTKLAQKGFIQSLLSDGLTIYVMNKQNPLSPNYVLSQENGIKFVGQEKDILRHPAEIMRLAESAGVNFTNESSATRFIRTSTHKGNTRIY